MNWAKWFEIPARDLSRAKVFYETTFDVELQPFDLGEMKMLVFPADHSEVSGAICFHPEFYHPSHQGSMVYLNADGRMEQILNRIAGGGGKIIVPRQAINEDFGFMAVFEDSEGNRLALHSAD